MTTFSINEGVSITSLGKPVLGLNLSPPNDSSPTILLNRIQQCRRWTIPGYTSTQVLAFLDANGELVSLPSGVTQASQLIVAVEGSAASVAAVGAGIVGVPFRYRWQGGGTDVGVEFGSMTLTKNADRDYTITLNSMSNASLRHSGLSGDNLPRLQTLVPVAHLALFEDGKIFTPEFLDHLRLGLSETKKLVFLRYMDWMNTNLTQLVEWADRATPARKNQASPCLEYLVALANELGINPWFCFGNNYSESHVRLFTQFVKDNLDSGLVPYFENTNEAWNFIFGQTQDNIKRGGAYFGTSGGIEYLNYHVMRSTRAMRIVTEVYGDNRNYQRVLAWGNSQYDARVLSGSGWQAACPDEHTSPGLCHDVIAINTYFAYGLTGGASGIDLYTTLADEGQAAALAKALTYLPGELASSLSPTASWRKAAEDFGMPLISYEGGQHVSLVAGVHNVMYRHIFTVPNGTAFEVGETVTQSTRSAVVKAKSATTIEIENLTNASWTNTGVLTGLSSGAVQTPTKLTREDPKPGVLDMLEALNYSEEMAAFVKQMHRNFIPAGGSLQCAFSDRGAHSKFGSWGMRYSLTDVSPRRIAFVEDVQDIPRTKAFRGARNIPTPSTRYAAYSVTGLTEVSANTWRAKAGALLTADPTGLLGTETVTYSWRVNGVEKATGPTLTFAIDADYPVDANLTCVSIIDSVEYSSRAIVIVA